MRSRTLPYPHPSPPPPTEPLPLCRSLAPTEPPADEIATTNHIPVVAREPQPPPPHDVGIPPIRRGAAWYARVAVSIVIVAGIAAVAFAA